MAQTDPDRAVEMEYRAVVECAGDPCTYCRSAKSRHVDKGTHETPEDALESGQKLASYVYGASTHHVQVEGREVSPWTALDMAGQRR